MDVSDLVDIIDEGLLPECRIFGLRCTDRNGVATSLIGSSGGGLGSVVTTAGWLLCFEKFISRCSCSVVDLSTGVDACVSTSSGSSSSSSEPASWPLGVTAPLSLDSHSSSSSSSSSPWLLANEKPALGFVRRDCWGGGDEERFEGGVEPFCVFG